MDDVRIRGRRRVLGGPQEREGRAGPDVAPALAREVDRETVRQLVELVSAPEFPKGLDTTIRIGDVEGNNGVNGDVCVCAHMPGDVVLSIDPHAGDEEYDPEG